MFKMDKRLSNILTQQLFLVVIFCVCCLGMHLLMESLGNAEHIFLIELIEHGNHYDPAHESDEESFVLLHFSEAGLISMSSCVGFSSVQNRTSFSFGPILPPPKSI